VPTLRINGVAMSGMPIVHDSRSAIGVTYNSGIDNDSDEQFAIGPALVDQLRGCLLRVISDGRFRYLNLNAAPRSADESNSRPELAATDERTPPVRWRSLHLETSWPARWSRRTRRTRHPRFPHRKSLWVDLHPLSDGRRRCGIPRSARGSDAAPRHAGGDRPTGGGEMPLPPPVKTRPVVDDRPSRAAERPARLSSR
jgi:hypothetical protein